MEASCPHCGKTGSAPDEMAGALLTCPGCGKNFRAPYPDHLPRCCPNCRAPLEPGTKLCVSCGFDLERGELLHTKAWKPEDDYPLWKRAIVWVSDILPGLFRPLTLTLFCASIVVALGMAFLGLMILLMGIPFAGISVAAGGMMIYGQGLSFLFTARVQSLKSAYSEIEGDAWSAFLVLLILPFACVLTIMVLVAKH